MWRGFVLQRRVGAVSARDQDFPSRKHFLIIISIFSGLNVSGDGSDQYLVELQKQLPDFLSKSRADGTVRRYTCAFNKWKEFANLHRLRLWPAGPEDFCLYLLHLSKSAKGISAIDAVFYGIKWVHDCLDLKSPTDYSSVKNAYEAAKRQLSRPRSPMAPIPSEVLRKLCSDNVDSSDLKVVRSVTMSVLAFAGFLRADELRQLQTQDILMHENFVTIVLRQSKTDQFRQGNHVDVAKTGNLSCPVFWLNKYFSAARIDLNIGGQFVFRQISVCKAGKKLVSVNKPLSYTATKEAIIPLVKKYMGKGAKVGMHSFRSGGATTAAKARVPGRLLQRHGRWKCEASKNMYIEESLEQRLEVSAALGL